MPLISFAQIKEESRERANMENSGFISDSELGRYVNKSIRALYDLIMTKYGEDYFVNAEPFEIVVNNTQDKYDLPDDFYKVVGVDLKVGTNNGISMQPFMWQERNNYLNSYIASWGEDGVVRARYRIMDNNPGKIWFIPSPTGGFNVDLWYVPVPPELEDEDDEFNGFNGWEEYVIIDAAIKMLGKEESATKDLKLERQLIIDRITETAANRDIGMSHRVQDVNSSNYDWLDGVY